MRVTRQHTEECRLSANELLSSLYKASVLVHQMTGISSSSSISEALTTARSRVTTSSDQRQRAAYVVSPPASVRLDTRPGTETRYSMYPPSPEARFSVCAAQDFERCHLVN